MAALWDLTEALEAGKQIEKLNSITTAARMDNLDGFMEVDDLQPDRNLSQEEINDLKDYLDKNPAIKKRFVSQDDQYFLVTVQPYNSEGLNLFRDELVSIADPILADYEVHYGGQAYVTGTIPAMIREDVQSLMLLGILIMVVILLINLRSVPGVAMVLMVIGLSLFAMIHIRWRHIIK
jgi:predicted RND superfamily exporter protein